MTQYIKTNLSCKDVGYLSQSDDIASTGKLSVDIISGRIFYPDVPIFHTISNEFPGSNVSSRFHLKLKPYYISIYLFTD